MRLTDEILKKAYDCTEEQVNTAMMLSAAGRFGLLPNAREFNLQIDINNGFIEVGGLDCLGLTKGGCLIDVQFDSQFTTSFETRVSLPDSSAKVLMLLIEAHPSEWYDVNDGYEHPTYSFALIPENSPMSPYALPIGRLVNENEYGWHMDDINFVPPCLFVSSHRKFVEQQQAFYELLVKIDENLMKQSHSDGRNMMRIFWPKVRNTLITTDKEQDTMTPMQLFGNIQRIVSSFTIALELDDVLNLSDEDKQAFNQYALARYNYKDVYKRINEGLALNARISEKMERLQAAPEPAPRQNQPKAPTISDDQMLKKCTNTKARITITNNEPGATIYFTTDGTAPSPTSAKGTNISVANGFSNDRKREIDKTIIVKVMAMLNGVNSRINTYEITLHKNIERWTGIEI